MAENEDRQTVVSNAFDAAKDNTAVTNFTPAMRERLAEKRNQGCHGWDDPRVCSTDYLADKLLNNVQDGHLVDIANLAMMLSHRENGADALRGRDMVQGSDQWRKGYRLGHKVGRRGGHDGGYEVGYKDGFDDAHAQIEAGSALPPIIDQPHNRPHKKPRYRTAPATLSDPRPEPATTEG